MSAALSMDRTLRDAQEVRAGRGFRCGLAHWWRSRPTYP